MTCNPTFLVTMPAAGLVHHSDTLRYSMTLVSSNCRCHRSQSYQAHYLSIPVKAEEDDGGQEEE